jgi:uncharacterized protein YraI
MLSAMPTLPRRLLVALLTLLLSGMMPTAMQLSAQGAAAPTVLVHSDPVYLRDGPGTHYPSIVLLQSGSICTILGRSPDGWWNVNCPGTKPGWVRQDIVLTQGNTSMVPLLGASPASGTLPQASAPSAAALSASADSSIEGAVVLRKEDSFGAAENARLEPGDSSCPVRGRQLGGGEWWYVQCPDGRAGWASGAFVTITGNRGSVPSSGTLDTGWHSHFYPNTKNPAIQSSTSTILPGSDFELSFNWGTGASEAGVDNWAARFVRTLNMAPATYVISANADDGVRVYLDGKRIIDEWTEGSFDSRPRTFTAPLNGVHTIAVDYFDATGNAALTVRITPQTGTASVPAVPIASRLSVIENTWRAQYFSGASPGGMPTYEEYVYLPPPTDGSKLNQNWGYAGPRGVANADFFSAIFEGKFYFEDGDYGFITQSDDGSRVLINGMPVIEKWRVGNDRATNNFARIQAGWHTIRVEYFEETGLASITLWFWFKGFSGCISAGHCPE